MPKYSLNSNIYVGRWNSANLFPVGIAIPFSGNETQIPTGWIIADGRAVQRADHPALNSLYQAALYPYGNGDGSTTFNTPDLRGRAAVGKDDMGGVPAGRITGAGVPYGISGNTLGGVGGNETHTLDLTQIAAHSHASVSGYNNVSLTHIHGRDPAQALNLYIEEGSDITKNTCGREWSNPTNPTHAHPVGNTGGIVGVTRPHNNMSPFQTTFWIIKT